MVFGWLKTLIWGTLECVWKDQSWDKRTRCFGFKIFYLVNSIIKTSSVNNLTNIINANVCLSESFFSFPLIGFKQNLVHRWCITRINAKFSSRFSVPVWSFPICRGQARGQQQVINIYLIVKQKKVFLYSNYNLKLTSCNYMFFKLLFNILIILTLHFRTVLNTLFLYWMIV